MVGQGQAALIEHQVHYGHVKLPLLQPLEVVWVEDRVAVLRYEDPVSGHHLSHSPGNVGAPAPDV